MLSWVLPHEFAVHMLQPSKRTLVEVKEADRAPVPT
jgi:hypothetical protein